MAAGRRPGPGGARGHRSAQAFRAVAGNRVLCRLVLGYALFSLSEYAVWAAMLAYAYTVGGPATTGMVALAQLVPAALVAPLVAARFAHRRPALLLAVSYLVQAVGMTITGLAVGAGAELPAYAAAVLASVAVTWTRPAQGVLVPRLARDRDQLTAANVLLGWVEAGGMVAAGLLVGALISTAGLAAVFATGAGLAVAGFLLVLRLPLLPGPVDLRDGGPPAGSVGSVGSVGAGLRLAFGDPRTRGLVAVLGAQGVVVGALDVLFVVLAVEELGASTAWVGYLNSAYGAGALCAGGVGAALVGRALMPPLLASSVLLAGGLAACATGPGRPVTLGLLVAVGACRALVDVAGRTLLQRTVPAAGLGPVLGLVEGLLMAGLAVGSMAVPALIAVGGTGLALLGAASVVLLAAGGLVLQGTEADPAGLRCADLHVPDQRAGNGDQATLVVLEPQQAAAGDR